MSNPEQPVIASRHGFTVRVLQAVEDVTGLEEAWQKCRKTQERPSPDQELHTLAFGAASRPQQHLRVVALYDGDLLVGAAPLIVREDWRLRWTLSKLGLRRPLARWHLPLADFCGADFVGAIGGGAAEVLLKCMLETCKDCEVIRLDQLSADSAVYRLLTENRSQRAGRWLYRSRDNSRRWLMRIDGSFDQYLKKFSGKRRRHLKWEVQRLEDHFQGQLRLLKTTDRSGVSMLLRAASEVSAHSWQGKKLDPNLATKLVALADHGSLCCYVLLGEDQPLAFFIGRQSDGVCTADMAGFDARLDSLSPGKVMWNKVIQDLHDHADLDWLDLGTGDIAYKQFWGHEFYAESSIYLIKPSLRNAIAFWPVMAAMWPVNIGRRLFEAFNLRSAYDRTLHRLSKAFKRRS